MTISISLVDVTMMDLWKNKKWWWWWRRRWQWWWAYNRPL